MRCQFRFKPHLIIDYLGELVSLKLTKGNMAGLKPASDMADSNFGKLYVDKGYISKKLTGKLLDKEIKLITSIRKN